MLLNELVRTERSEEPKVELQTSPEELKAIGEIVGVRTGAPTEVEDDFV